jgi:hypothetical protein
MLHFTRIQVILQKRPPRGILQDRVVGSGMRIEKNSVVFFEMLHAHGHTPPEISTAGIFLEG